MALMHQPPPSHITTSLFSFPFSSLAEWILYTMGMDQLKYQNISSLTQSMKAHHYLIKLTQLFISVSVCSFLISPSSLLVFLHYFKFYFSTFPFQLFTHNIDKNSMFLLCNGLLVFVGITKSFSSGSSSDDDKPSSLGDLSSQYIEDGSQQSHVLDVVPMLEIEAKKETIEPGEEQNTAAEEAIEIKTCYEEEVQENIEKIIFIDEEQEQGKGCSQVVLKEEVKEVDEETELLDFDAADHEEDDKGSENDYFVIEENIEEEEEEDDVEEEEESCMLSTEELNKKFEDFIRKMKEDLRIDARRHLLMV